MTIPDQVKALTDQILVLVNQMNPPPPPSPDRITLSSSSLGMKSLLTTGSIPASCKTLTLASDPGFLVGDSIIVEIGREAGVGLRGTVGVGGVWPALSYATTAEMSADATQANDTFAWVTSTGDVYQIEGGVWTILSPTLYYTNKAIPLALKAKIIGKSGNSLTLDTAASVSAVDANIHFDNWPILNDLLFVDPTPYSSPVTLTLTDHYAVGGGNAPPFGITINRRDDWTITGIGPLISGIFSPNGVHSAQITLDHCNRVTISNFALRGNARNDGYGIMASQTVIWGYPNGIIFSRCSGGAVRDMQITDVFQDAVGTTYSFDIWAYNCSVSLTDGLQQYIQWMFQWADSAGGGMVDCSVTSPFLTPGFEIFRSKNVVMTRPISVNASFSLNSSGDWTVDTPNVTIHPMSQLSENSFSHSNPIINVNSNIQPPDPSVADGGSILNSQIIQSGYINSNNDVLIGIVIDAANPNVTIKGGEISLPDYMAPGALYGADGVHSQGTNTTIEGVCVKGAAHTFANINILNPGSGTVKNCYADVIVGGTQINNQPANMCPT